MTRRAIGRSLRLERTDTVPGTMRASYKGSLTAGKVLIHAEVQMTFQVPSSPKIIVPQSTKPRHETPIVDNTTCFQSRSETLFPQVGMLASLLFAMVPSASAQKPAADRGVDLSTENRRAATVATMAARGARERETARQTALQKGWPVGGATPDGGKFEIQRISAGGLPLYYKTMNVDAAISTAADRIRNTAPYNLNGSGFRVGVWDGSSVLASHQEFSGRVFVLDGSTPDDHATHVAGTIGAGGVNPAALGMAPSVRIDSYDWNSDAAEMAAAAATTSAHAGKVLVSNHSYGFISGWYGNLYYGNYPEREDSIFGRYGSNTAEWDAICYAAPYFLPFKSAGNDRSDPAPAPGQTFYYSDSGGLQSKLYDPAVDPYPDGWDNGGFDTMSSIGCAKNIMTVGAANDAVSGGVRSLANGTVAGFSGWGPTDDGRIKPDIVANGVDLRSASAYGDASSYYSSSGTSMSSPNAAGSAILLQQLHADLHGGEVMRASTLKGLIIQTADDLGRPGPDYSYGWGYMNAKAAADVIRNPAGAWIAEGTLSGATPVETYSFTSDGITPIRGTICWTDPAGTTRSALDDRTASLVNDLDIRITTPSGTHYPYVLNLNSPLDAATFGDNVVDNVEQVFIAAPPAGPCTVTVSHKGALDGGEQRYSLILNHPPSNPAPVVRFTDSSFQVDETGGQATISVVRTGAEAGAVSVQYETSGGSATPGADFTNVSGSLQWADGELGIRSFTVPILNNNLPEGDETANLVLSGVTGGAFLGNPSNAVLTIYDNDSVPPVISSPGTAVASTGQPFVYQITASGDPTGFSAEGLPAGLSIAPASGMISGTTNEVGNFQVTLTATNAAGSGSLVLELIVNPPVFLSFPLDSDPGVGYGRASGSSEARREVAASTTETPTRRREPPARMCSV